MLKNDDLIDGAKCIQGARQLRRPRRRFVFAGRL